MDNSEHDTKTESSDTGKEEKKSRFASFSIALDGDVEGAKREAQKIADQLEAQWEEQRLSRLHGYVDDDGNEIVPRKYQEVLEPSEGMIAVRSNTRWGYYNMQGELVIPFDYTYAYSFSEGLAGVRQNGKFGFIDKTGKVVIPFKYSNISKFSEGMAKVSIKDKYGYINSNGDVMIPIESTKLSFDFHEGLAWGWGVKGGVGFFDKHGNTIIPYEYQYGSDFQGGLAAVKKDKLWGLINKQNEMVVPFEYKLIGDLECDRRMVEKDGKYGFLDKDGKLVIEIKYDDAESFNPDEETAFVEIDGKYGYIDINGEVVEWVE